MDLFKKRSTAIVIFVIVVVVFSLIGCRRSLDRACREAEAAFFDADLLQADGYYTCPGDQLEHCVDYATRLLTVIGTDGAWADAYEGLVQARLGLMDALDARNIPGIAAANQALVEAVAAVEAVKNASAPMPDSEDELDALADGFTGVYEALVQAQRGIMSAFGIQDDQSIPDTDAARQTFEDIVSAAKAVRDFAAPMPDSYDDYDKIIAGFNGAQAVLANQAYNDHIAAFREDVLGVFPASVLWKLLGVKAPDTF